MEHRSDLDTAFQEVKTGINLAKCQQCGCMSETLAQMAESMVLLPGGSASELREALPSWVEKMKPIRYSCLGCGHCYAGAAQNAFTDAFPETEKQFGLSCEIQTDPSFWPPLAGEYFVVDPSAPVAVTTLASLGFSKQLSDLKIPGMAIVGKLETENIGLEKIIKNSIANSNLRFLILAGEESKGHLAGQTLLALAENGVDENNRVIGSKGKHPILRNVTQADVSAFREQIRVVDLIGCACVDCVSAKITELLQQVENFAPKAPSCDCSAGNCLETSPEKADIQSVFVGETGQQVQLDRAGYFVILPIPERKVIHVEHYDYDNNLLHIVEGSSARGLYLKIIEENWVSEMSHAAYLGKELAKAELTLAIGIPYFQDAA